MGGKTPQPVRLDVIRGWLQGHSRDGIAKEVKIGAGTVSGILKQCKQDDPEFDLLRAVALELRDRGLGVGDFAPFVRLKSLLEDKEVELGIVQNDDLFAELKKFEKIIVSIEVLCFKAGMDTDQFFEHVLEQALLADKYRISLLLLPTLLGQMERDIKKLKEERNRQQVETESEVKRHGATMNLLQKYLVEKPSLDSARVQLEKAVGERDSCQSALDSLRKEYDQKVREQTEEAYSWYADPREEEKAARKLGSNSFEEDYTRWLRKPGLKAILLHLYHYQGNYVEVIRKIIDTYNSLNE